MKNTMRLLAVVLCLTLVFSMMLTTAAFADKPDKSKQSGAGDKGKSTETKAKDVNVKAAGTSTTQTTVSGTSLKTKADLEKAKQERAKTKQQIKNSYNINEVKALALEAAKIKQQNKNVTILPVENIIVKGKNIKFDMPPVIKSGSILIPVRGFAQSFGAAVNWDNATQQVTITKGDQIIVIKVDNMTAVVNGVEVKLDAPAQKLNGRTVVSLKFIAESLGLKMVWNVDDQTAEIEEGTGTTTGTGTDTTGTTGTTGTTDTSGTTDGSTGTGATAPADTSSGTTTPSDSSSTQTPGTSTSTETTGAGTTTDGTAGTGTAADSGTGTTSTGTDANTSTTSTTTTP